MVRCILIALLLAATPVSACIWDNDTLRDEQRGLPGVYDIIAGRYERRSDYFYRDRIARMQKHLVAQPEDQKAIDNLAVALFRVGDKQQAIDLMLDKEKRFPDQYTTSSNLATFYMLSGDSAAAIPLLEKAIKINPEAHFGREVYQLQLAKFLVEAAKQDQYPTADFLGNQPFEENDGKVNVNSGFTYKNTRGSGKLDPNDAKAVLGILGMIRFGSDASPDLWYALGNLMLKKGDRHHAYRAYVMAVECKHPRAAEIQNLMARASGIIAEDAPTVESVKKERDAAGAWTKAYMDYADGLIRAGKNPDDEANYKPFYKKNPTTD